MLPYDTQFNRFRAVVPTCPTNSYPCNVVYLPFLYGCDKNGQLSLLSRDDETIQRLGGSNKILDKRVLLLQMVAKRTKTLVVATFERGDLKPKLPLPPFFGAFGTGAPNFLSVK